jgi:nucleotide-binding universal stress UspA family protein
MTDTTTGPSGINGILAATDLSPRADKAIARAAHLAAEHEAALTVLHVLSNPTEDKARRRQVALEVERQLRRKMAQFPPVHEMTIEVASGTVFLEIIRRARLRAAELIVVGAHGRHFIKDLLIGTTATKIVRQGDRPVLVVKRAAHGPYRRVLAATDFSESSRRALELGLRLAPGAKFTLLHAYEGIEGQLWRADFAKSKILRYRREVAQQSRKSMKQFMAGIDLQGKSIARLLRHGRAPHVIAAVAHRLRPDLVCVGSVGRTGLPYVLLGSVAEHVMHEAGCDVVVARSASPDFKLP